MRYIRPVAAVYDTDWQEYSAVAGDCFDWLDHDTRELVLEAINLNDTDDIDDFAEIAGACPLAKFARTRQQYKRLGQKLRKTVR
jgi:hypothetical protein